MSVSHVNIFRAGFIISGGGKPVILFIFLNEKDRSMKKLLWLSFFYCAQSEAQFFKVLPGRFKPGFISLSCFDSSRPAVEEQPIKNKGRILQVNVWYPSMGNTERMRFKDYVELAGKELDASPQNKNYRQKGVDKYFEWPASTGADKKKFYDFLSTKTSTLAYKDAVWLKRRFPLAILVHGFAADHAYLAEYLASHGYVILQVPVKGTKKYELDYEGNGLETQVLDYEFALAMLQEKFPIVSGEMAAVGFSFGAQSALALALRNKKVKAVISLDGGIGSLFGVQLLNKQDYYRDDLVNLPVLHLYNPGDTHSDLTLFNRISKADRLLAGMKSMQHGHFTSFGLLNRQVPGIPGKEAPDPGNGYEAIMLLTKEFLNQYVNGKQPAENSFFDYQVKAEPWLKDCVETMNYIPAGSRNLQTAGKIK